MSLTELIVIEYRNAKYQGHSKNRIRDGIGILLDDNMNFYCSSWQQNQLNGSTLIFSEHGKYIYGNWSQDRPQGFNIFRSGDIAILANYENGGIEGEFIIIFEKQNLLVTVEKTQDKYNIVEKRQFNSYEQINSLVSKLKSKKQVPKQYFSLIKFLKSYFISNQSSLKLSFLKNTYFFGYLDGIAIMFDDDHFIHRVGNTREDGEMFGIGALYKQSNNEQGNFATKITVKYKNTRPNTKIQKLLMNQHKKSINFENNYVRSIATDIFTQLQKIVKQEIILQIANDKNNQLDTNRSYSQDQLNRSLEFRPKALQQGQRLKAIREQIYKSIGRPGVSIKPLPQYVSRPIELSSTPKEKFEQKIDSLMFKKYNLEGQIRRQRFIENKIPIVYENLDQRRERIQQQYRKSHQKKTPMNLSPDRILFKKDDQPTTNIKKDYPTIINQQNIHYNPKRNSIFNQNTRIKSPIKPKYQINDDSLNYQYKTPQKIRRQSNNSSQNINSYSPISPITHLKYSNDNKFLNSQTSKNGLLKYSQYGDLNNNYNYHYDSKMDVRNKNKYEQKSRPTYIPKDKSKYFEYQ